MKTNKKKEKLVTQENPVIDLKGEKCEECNRGYYQETSLMDDLSGTLHCTKCDKRVTRYSRD
jgi:hypothetical protein